MWVCPRCIEWSAWQIYQSSHELKVVHIFDIITATVVAEIAHRQQCWRWTEASSYEWHDWTEECHVPLSVSRTSAGNQSTCFASSNRQTFIDQMVVIDCNMRICQFDWQFVCVCVCVCPLPFFLSGHWYSYLSFSCWHRTLSLTGGLSFSVDTDIPTCPFPVGIEPCRWLEVRLSQWTLIFLPVLFLLAWNPIVDWRFFFLSVHWYSYLSFFCWHRTLSSTGGLSFSMDTNIPTCLFPVSMEFCRWLEVRFSQWTLIFLPVLFLLS